MSLFLPSRSLKEKMSWVKKRTDLLSLPSWKVRFPCLSMSSPRATPAPERWWSTLKVLLIWEDISSFSISAGKWREMGHICISSSWNGCILQKTGPEAMQTWAWLCVSVVRASSRERVGNSYSWNFGETGIPCAFRHLKHHCCTSQPSNSPVTIPNSPVITPAHTGMRLDVEWSLDSHSKLGQIPEGSLKIHPGQPGLGRAFPWVERSLGTATVAANSS